MSNVSYNELKEAFEKIKKIEKLKEGYSEMSILRPKPGDIVVAYFNWNDISATEAADMHKSLVEIMPDQVSVITIPDTTQLIAYGPDQFATEMFYLMDEKLGREKFIKVLQDELDRIDGDDLK